MWEYVVHPFTKQRLSIFSEEGRHLLKKYLSSFMMTGGRSPNSINRKQTKPVTKRQQTSKARNRKKIARKSISRSKPRKLYSPKKYYEGLSSKDRKARLKRFKQGAQTLSNDPQAYVAFPTDFRDGQRIPTKPSSYTQQWKAYFPEAQSLESKAEATGVPMHIIRKVFNKGLAAYRTGHRPGATQQQWAYARVHSFLVKGKTYYTTDKKLAEEAKAESLQAQVWYNSIFGKRDPSVLRGTIRLEDKSDATGVDISILQKLFKEGVRKGRETGETNTARLQQFGNAYVNTFLLQQNEAEAFSQACKEKAVKMSSKAQKWFQKMSQNSV